MHEELERSPFARSLSLLVHRLPPPSQGVWDWDVDRGFHLEVLSESCFSLRLRSAQAGSEPPLALLDPGRPPSGGLLLWQRSPGPESQWREFAERLQSGSPWDAGLILEPWSERWSSWRAWWRRRDLWRGVNCPVVEVFQKTPSPAYFTVEKNLFALGRVGRRLGRYRRWLP